MNGEMFERYNEPARRSLFFARYEASVLGSLTIDTGHLLLGILKVREPLLDRLIGSAGLSPNAVRQQVQGRAGSPASPVSMSVEIPLSRDAKHVLECSAEESERLLHRQIGTEHLLLGLLRVERGLAWDILREKGLALEKVREAFVMHVSATSPPPPEIAWIFSDRHDDRARLDPYLMTALDGSHPGRRATADDGASFGAVGSFSVVGFSTPASQPPDGTIHSIGPISMSGTTLARFALMLEEFLGEPIMVIDQNGLTDRFDIELQGEYDNPETLIAALHDQLGLLLTRTDFT